MTEQKDRSYPNHKNYSDTFISKYCQDKVKYCSDFKSYLVWDGKRWKIEHQDAVLVKFDSWIAELYQELEKIDYEEEKEDRKKKYNQINYISNFNNQNRILEYARRNLHIDQSELDQNTTLLNFNNGTVDLVSGELLKHDPDQLITKVIDYDYNPDANYGTRWSQFLTEIMDHDQEMVDFLQVAAGYAVTGSVSEQVLFMLYGGGANGKGTFCETLLSLLGDYAWSVSEDFFATSKRDTHPTSIADLRGKRLVIGSEFTGNRLNESFLKRQTGGDQITARVMRGDNFNFDPTHQFFILVNDRPQVHGLDRGIWRRLKLIPFTVEFGEDQKEKDLNDKLINSKQYASNDDGYNEAQSILKWVVDGAVKYYAQGKIEWPEKIQIATTEYREDMDDFGQFLEQCITYAPGERITRSKLHEIYTKWCASNGVKFVGSPKWVATQMRQRENGNEKNYESKKSGGYWYWQDVEFTLEAHNLDRKNYGFNQNSDDFGEDGEGESQSQQGLGNVGKVIPLSSYGGGSNAHNAFHLPHLPQNDDKPNDGGGLRPNSDDPSFPLPSLSVFKSSDLNFKRNTLVRMFSLIGLDRDSAGDQIFETKEDDLIALFVDLKKQISS
jgi:putative DNA primase/helicase